ncbi:TPA: DUF4007 family protein [Pseudomonas aeruginosa]|uniref:DUF4007 family protein n=1 Tax=Pseudomonas aeruginosa TaxID=287 RepID=UPI0021E1BE25|nr:DUF4007 family protein [Pseudomonas aeruginosa]WJQ20782.1 DUF4007 family protein [Pseudomonas aeruginosa]GLE61611.1 hypothetical protein VNPA110516_17910 [Pseudomonas aeruginosa]GLE74849.1 hypothetical protein VNPA120641_17150 [Pseudomonas aeruginosa]GLE89967.1 hypothetical protein VNPA120719_33570 [Pseudomonas aeruginosa]HCL3747591.1 DUF4007 family protein [Pseudomonas aeruginosa]
MAAVQRREERFSGHESFVCRYGWLPKLHNAVANDPFALKDEAQATITLGIGRNMVKSVQFWGEAFGIIEAREGGGLQSGPLGQLLLSKDGGWDRFLEQSESLWLLHWWITTHADVAVWNLVFGKSTYSRFDRRALIAGLVDRADKLGKKLAGTTLEQHASIFLHSYKREESASDDTSWCPLQDLGLFEQTTADDGKTVYLVGRNAPLGLSPRIFLFAVVDFYARHRAITRNLTDLTYGEFSPGVVFRLDEFQVRALLEGAEQEFPNVLRFVDTADTQQVVLEPALVPEWAGCLWVAGEELNV